MRNPESTVRYLNVRIDSTPTVQYPKMVTIVRTPTLLNDINNRRFNNITNARFAVDVESTEVLIQRGNRNI